MDLFTESGATFSRCREYRYHLWRVWDSALPLCTFIMLNPSSADEAKNDPTVERCERRARGWGYGGLMVGNIFALRSTDPRALYAHPAPIGQDNDAALCRAAERSALVVCAWGTHGAHQGRGRSVAAMLARCRPLSALVVTASGHPGHPLYLPYTAQPFLWPGYPNA